MGVPGSPQKDGPSGPWPGLEVGSAGCGRGHRGRVLGCPDRSSRERRGKSLAQGGGGTRAGRGGSAARLGRGGRCAALRSPWPPRYGSERRRHPRGPGPPGPCGLRRCGCCRCCSVASAPLRPRQVSAAPDPRLPGCRVHAWVPPGACTRPAQGRGVGGRSAAVPHRPGPAIGRWVG